ncbi:MAG: LamG domain-containing protein [Victivallaceae bacterium]|nr:LamG domain-containing protein [Victivallaceae bacterium]
MNGKSKTVKLLEVAAVAMIVIFNRGIVSANETVADDSLRLKLHFDENQGKIVKDAGPYANAGEIIGDCCWTASGKLNSALKFNGKNSCVRVVDRNGALHISDAITMEAWIRLEDNSGKPAGIIDKGIYSQRSGYILGIEKNHAKFFIGAGPEIYPLDLRSAILLRPGRWYHLRGTFDGQNGKLFVDGKLEAEGSFKKPETIANVSDGLVIGGHTPKSDLFNGMIDEVAIYSKALSPGGKTADK